MEMTLLEDHNHSAVAQSANFDGGDFQNLIYNVGRWAEERNITKEGGATSYSQLRKLEEEIREFEEAANHYDAFLEFGDILVVVLQIARLRGLDINQCLSMAYEKIRHRKGRMENGVFVKEV